MANAEMQRLLESIAQRYGLRYLERSRHYLGIHDGLCIDLFEYDQTVYFHVFARTAYLKDQVLEQFQGFTHLNELGVSTDWIKGDVEGSTFSPNSCTLKLTPERLRTITLEQFLEIPERLKQDMRSFGAEESVGDCSRCGAESPRSLMHFGGVYAICCDDCRQAVQDEAHRNKLRVNQSVNWLEAGKILLISTFVYGVVWGMVQQPFIGGKVKDGRVFLVLPFLGAVWLSGLVARAAGGTSLALRFATVVCSLAAVLAGNVWRFHTLVLQHVQITWLEAIELYFTRHLPLHYEFEAWFLAGGVIGAWCGAGILKSAGFIKIE